MTQTLISGWRLRILLTTVLLSAAAYLAFALWGGWVEVLAAVVRVGWAGVLVALALSLVNYGLRFVRWQLFLKALGYRVQVRESLRIYLAGFGLTILPGKVGEAIRGVFLKQHGVAYTESLAAFFSEQFFNLISMLMLVSIGLWVYPAAQPVVWMLAVCIVIVLVLFQQTVWLQALQHWLANRVSQRLARVLVAALETVRHAGRLFRLPMLAQGLALGLIAWGAEGLAFYYFMHLLGSSLSLSAALFIYAFSMLVGALSFLPGGLGGTEASMVALLVLNSVPHPVAVAATVLIRLATLWFAVALGMLALLMPEQKNRVQD